MAKNMYNPNGSLNASWVFNDQIRIMEERARERILEYSYLLDNHNTQLTSNDYEEAFNFLKQHSNSMTDEQIALEVLRNLK